MQGESERVPDAVAPPPRHPRFPLVDGVRALAVLSVVAVHGPGGLDLAEPFHRLVGQLGIGVRFFFVISGFLLYRPFVAWRAGGAEAPRFRDYGWRRFLRIYPAYWVALTLLTILPGFIGASDGGALAQYGLVHTLPVLGGPVCFGFTNCDLAQTWSLVVELSFYLLLPVYVIAARRLARRLSLSNWAAAEIAMLAGLALLALTWRYFVADDTSPWINRTVLGEFGGFAVGMAFAVLSVASSSPGRPADATNRLGRRPGLLWGAAATLYVVICFWLPSDFLEQSRAQEVLGNVLLTAVAAMVFIPAVFGTAGAGWPRRLLAHPVVAWVGLVSYGIFLWHVPIADRLADLSYLVGVPLVIALSIAVAAASYYVVERPILRLKTVTPSQLLAKARLRPRASG